VTRDATDVILSKSKVLSAACSMSVYPLIATEWRTLQKVRVGPQADIQNVFRDRLFRRHAARLDRGRPF
jgi:hypothetical protein